MLLKVLRMYTVKKKKLKRISLEGLNSVEWLSISLKELRMLLEALWLYTLEELAISQEKLKNVASRISNDT